MRLTALCKNRPIILLTVRMKRRRSARYSVSPAPAGALPPGLAEACREVGESGAIRATMGTVTCDKIKTMAGLEA